MNQHLATPLRAEPSNARTLGSAESSVKRKQTQWGWLYEWEYQQECVVLCVRVLSPTPQQRRALGELFHPKAALAVGGE